ncbi:TVP38/TMEM64 family inner membrane protein ydjZ [Campylobacter hyointestinalis subsp. hyointestinalis]|uniref:TVP38/TMEM64 family membrane protein n=1 Tax=Campylobacter hyointestinalis subsp. hyointestinalis TaxID=91352 RepID=A0A0S4S6M4_CAMHY|nr:VTT domain-containing protein [Campylobacter hyointestinalis]PPB54826.1 TVP38/TMEM64 family protein [Campylobacter hyointestinalis subsp. hyointestinalis]PPB59835.1 TVP38/TMEM64 family protein [Campylobacter hyointestinalis subsp. hyointestinalis]PPB62383.1 TVP38/TMEM64 family protein [Campylobacter hyointestinalis subsp. hyointestinalis]CUU80788.1 TVP38/TMEM64 family inner membrane protein ydjZ [Campylobacter hyointestinalis subsp. hyointestinalis]CUU81844.1 TVP38/TMEM64 family inner membr
MTNKNIVKFCVLCTLCCICVIVYLNLDTETLRLYIEKQSKFSEIIYILLWIILPIFMFPAAVLAVVGGVFFGLFKGLVLTMIGVAINSVIMYFIGKYLGKDFLARFFDVSKFKKAYIKDEFFTIFLLRLIPLIPYNAINYFAGVFAFRFWRFFLGSFLGKIISSVVFLNLGLNVTDIGSTKFFWAVFWVFVLVILSVVLRFGYDKIYEKDKS